jgi:hypothetical protein
MELAPQPVRCNLRAKPAPPNVSICAQCACIDSAISTFRTLSKAAAQYRSLHPNSSDIDPEMQNAMQVKRLESTLVKVYQNKGL